MSGARTPVQWLLALAYGVLWLGGVATLLTRGQPPDGLAWTSPLFLAVAAAWILGNAPRSERVPLVLAGVIGWSVELIGVRWGVPFGTYRYSAALGPAVGGVPIAIAAAWCIVAGGARQWMAALVPDPMRQVRYGPWWAAAFITVADFIIDPVAAGPLGFWTWSGGGAYYGIPTVNFFGWFVTGLGWAWWVRTVPAAPSRAVARIYESVVGMFTVLAVGCGLWIPALVGAAHLAIHCRLIEFRTARKESP